MFIVLLEQTQSFIIVYDNFQATLALLSSCDRDYMAHEAKNINIYYIFYLSKVKYYC